jgi:hypothetical protein
MEIALNYGVRRYFISNNYFYFLVFISAFIFFSKRKQKRNMERKTPISDLNYRGGSDPVILQKLYDQCLSDDLYVQVNDSRVKQIIRRMLNSPANEPIIISASVYLVAILKNKHASLILQRGGTRLIVENFRVFMTRSVGSVVFAQLLALGSGPIFATSIPLMLIALLYSHLNIDCNSFVDTLPKTTGGLQHIETIVNNDAPIIVAPYSDKPIYYEFDETKASSFPSFSCYMKGNCLGPERIQRKGVSKTRRFIPLSERTKTLKDLNSHVEETNLIDVNSLEYKQKD